MFREMRRERQKLSEEETADILNRGTFGVLALCGDDDYPYAVPMSYVYKDSKIFFHGAKSGHKIDAVKKCGKASFCVVDRDQIIPEEYTTYFRSAIAFGTIRIMDGEEEKRAAVELLAKKYHPHDSKEGRSAAIDREWNPLCMMELSIEHMTGKEAIELVKEKGK